MFRIRSQLFLPKNSFLFIEYYDDFSFNIGKIVTASNINKAGWGLMMSLVESSIRIINLEFS
jgi:hypothetical protein